MWLHRTSLVVLPAPCILVWLCFVFNGVAAAKEMRGKASEYPNLPAGATYKLSTEKTTAQTGLNEIATRIATGIKSHPPYEIINQYIKKRTVSQSQILDYETPLIVLAAISLAFAVLVPLVGLLVCCCRLAGHCGGDLDDRKIDIRPTKKRKRYALAIVVSSIILITGSGIIFASGIRMRSSVPETRTTVSNVFDDVMTYKNNTFKEVNFMLGVEGLQILRDLINEVADLAGHIATPVITEGAVFVNDLVKAISKIGTAMDTSLILMEKVETTIDSLVATGNKIKSDLSKSKQDLTAAQSDCNTQAPPGSAVCDVIPGGDELEPVANFTKVPDINSTAASVKDVVKLNLKHEAAKGNETFHNIPREIKNLVSNLTESFKNFTINVDQIKQDVMRPLEDQVDEILQENVLSYKKRIDKYLQPDGIVHQYDSYRNLLYILTGVIVLVNTSLALVGITLGICGASTFDTPSTRGDLSDVGGRILIGSGGLFVLSAFLVNVLAGLTFLAGSNTAVVCSSIPNYQLLRETIDDPKVMDGYPLSSLLYKDSKIKLTISDVLKECDKNMAPWTVLHMDRMLNLTDVLDYKDKIPSLDEVFEDLNKTVQNTSVITDKANKGVKDSLDAGVQNISFADYTNQTVKPIVNVSLSSYAANISKAANTTGMPPSVSKTLQSTAENLIAIDDQSVGPSKTKAAELEALVGQLERQGTIIKDEVTEVQKGLEKVEHFLQNDALRIVTKEALVHSERVFADVDAFLAHLVSQVRYKVGRCKPVHNIYRSLSATVCYGYFGGLNASWIGFGLCAVFSLISIILCVRAAKHFRRVRKAEPNRDSDFDLHTMNLLTPMD